MNNATKEALEEVRTMLGPKGSHMNYAELIKKMAELSLFALKVKKFGKKNSLGTSKASNNKFIKSAL